MPFTWDQSPAGPLPRCRECGLPMSVIRVDDRCGICKGGVTPPPRPVDLRVRRPVVGDAE